MATERREMSCSEFSSVCSVEVRLASHLPTAPPVPLIHVHLGQVYKDSTEVPVNKYPAQVRLPVHPDSLTSVGVELT